MTKTVNLKEVSIESVIALTRNGDDVIVEEDGAPAAKITPIEKPEIKQRVLGLGAEKDYFMSDDFDDELPDEFWGFDKEL
jgi:antitoxin (DNA-binding transcriptional repressor) of toxin-antitoxin stability system